MQPLAAILALFVAAAGWFYLFYSGGAKTLANLEDERLNRKRIVLRRTGGIAMMLLGVCFFMLFWRVNLDEPGTLGLVMLMAVMILLLIVLVLAGIDLRLTWKLRRQVRGRIP